MNGRSSDSNEIWWLETVGGHHWIATSAGRGLCGPRWNSPVSTNSTFEDALRPGTHKCCKVREDPLPVPSKPVHLTSRRRTQPRSNPGAMPSAPTPTPDHVYNTPRAWYMQRFLNPYDEVDGPDADHKPTSDDIPWARQPERKVTIEVAQVR